MPKIELDTRVIVASLGGGVLYSSPGTLSDFAKNDLPDWLYQQRIIKRSVVAVVGGGPEAREEQNQLLIEREHVSRDQLDEIGIKVTWKNAMQLFDMLQIDYDLPVKRHSFGIPPLQGVIYLRGGTIPGHTTDLVALEMGLDLGQPVVLNISKETGLHPVQDSQMQTSTIIETITWDDLAKMAPEHHVPGSNFLVDPVAIQFGKNHKMTMALLGPDSKNITSCVNGKTFTGTLVHP